MDLFYCSRLTCSQYGTAHEHKGPADFNGRNNDDEDDEDATPPLEDQPEHALPQHLQNNASYAHMRPAPSASPPIGNGVPYRSTSQMGSRPGSRNTIRRPSSNLGHMQMSQPASNPNGYAYVPNPPIYNPQGPHGLASHHSVTNQQHHGQSIPSQQHGYYGQQQHPQHTQVQHAYSHNDRRSSMPPAFPQIERPQQQPMQSPPPPQHGEAAQPEEDDNQLRAPKPISKSRSIFTPIDEGRSLLAQHWGDVKVEKKTENDPRSQSVDFGRAPPHTNMRSNDRGPTRHADPETQSKTQRIPPPPSRSNQAQEFPPPSRTNSVPMGAKRPQLKVQIPSEKSDDEGSASAESSPRQSNIDDTPAKGSTEASHSSSGVVLPPPSPSASAILSAGAQGPPNPFARPHPPNHASQNSHGNNNNNIETPISALPSRFVADALLPSPSTFYPEWGFGRVGGEGNTLPSPLNFQTPVAGNGPGFREEDAADKKRKSPEGEQETSNLKRVKT